MNPTLLKNILASLPIAAAADGQAATNGTGLDMSGYEGVLFVATVGTITGSGTFTLKAQQSSDDGSEDAYSDIEGSSVDATAAAESDKVVILDIYNPQKRYVRPVLTRATANSVLGGVVAIRYGARKAPVTQSSDVADSDTLVAPAEGTA